MKHGAVWHRGKKGFLNELFYQFKLIVLVTRLGNQFPTFDISFKIAGLQAFRQAFQQADPQLLEPINHVEILCPDELTGSVMGDLQSRRAIVEGIDTQGHFQKVIAKVPQAEMDGYSSSLRSITQGRAKFSMRFHEYASVPFEEQRRLIDEYMKVAKEELV